MRLIDEIIKRPVAVAFGMTRGSAGSVSVDPEPDRVLLTFAGGGTAEITAATPDLAGVLSAADKGKLDTLSAGAGFGRQVVRVADIPAMKALPDIVAGQLLMAGDELFVAVDDPSLGADGATVFIPDQHLSAQVSDTISTTAFSGATGANIGMEVALSHAGIDLESVECVLTDGGETITGWHLHGHSLNKHADFVTYDLPFLPLIDVDAGAFRSPLNWLTKSAVVTRTGGMLVRYKYATSGIRLKRVADPGRIDLRWWPVTANDLTVDDTNYVAWAQIYAHRTGAAVIDYHDFYSIRRSIELAPALHRAPCGPGTGGLRVMSGVGYEELLLARSSAPNAANFPLATAILAFDRYLNQNAGYTPTLSLATGQTFLGFEDFEFDGNILNNLGVWSNHADYAWAYANSNGYFHNAPVYSGLNVNNHGGRDFQNPVLVQFSGTCKFHGFGGLGIVGYNTVQARQTGTLIVGDCLHNHLFYWLDGVFDHVQTFGFHWGDGIRSRDMTIRHLEQAPTRFPDVMYDNAAAVPSTRPTSAFVGLSHAYETVPQFTDARFPGPQMPPFKLVVGRLDVDMAAMGDLNGRAVTPYIPMALAGDDIDIQSGRIRGPVDNDFIFTRVINLGGNGFQYGPFRNVSVNLHVEHKSRVKPPMLLFGGVNLTGYAQADFRITLEPVAASPLPEDAGPDGNYFIISDSMYLPGPVVGGGTELDFAALTASGIGGQHFDVTPPDAGAPKFRVWYDYNASSAAPSGTGMTLIEVDIGVGETTANIAKKTGDAIRANASAASYLTAWHHAVYTGTKLVLGSLTRYGFESGNKPTFSLGTVPGLTSADRAHRRQFEPMSWRFRNSQWSDNTAIGIIKFMGTPAAWQNLRLAFDECVLGAWETSHFVVVGSGALHNAGVISYMDRVRAVFEDCVLDLRDGATWQNLDFLLYASRFRGCTVRTGNATLGDGLRSEAEGEAAWTADGAATHIDIPTKLFWAPKYVPLPTPGNAATAAHMQANACWVEVRRSTGAALGGTGAYYQGPDGVNEDRRAPILRLHLGTAPANGTAMLFRWSAAVSP